jgi:hypothetical protein
MIRTVIGGWFAVRTFNNQNNLYTQLPNLLSIFLCNMYLIYKCGRPQQFDTQYIRLYNEIPCYRKDSNWKLCESKPPVIYRSGYNY